MLTTLTYVIIVAVLGDALSLYAGWRFLNRHKGTVQHHRPHVPHVALPVAPPITAELDLPPGEAFARWLVALKRRHLRALIHHPHHYFVAAGLSLGLLAVGHWETGAITAAWLYAVVENVATAAEAIVFEA